jgi:hypothetical protein
MKFHGRVGYGASVEDTPGVYVEHIVERTYFGDVNRNIRSLTTTEKVNPDISVSNAISIVADPYARENFMAIRYVEYAGVLWTVNTVEVQFPRLVLQLGEVYNGPTPAAP